VKILAIVFCAFSTVLTLCAHDIITTKLTYTRDISRIFARRCQACHSSTDSIPLTTYEQVRPWAVSIKEQILSRQMPPWGAVKGFGDLSPDNGLGQEEIMIVAAWVVGGAPMGNPSSSALDTAHSPLQQPSAEDRTITDGALVSNRSTIDKPLALVGIRPIGTVPVASARITATFPDGHVEPLLWLFHYDPKWPQIFRFREPVSLPSGSIVEADSPLNFALEITQVKALLPSQ
jgi:hypothetical protein